MCSVSLVWFRVCIAGGARGAKAGPVRPWPSREMHSPERQIPLFCDDAAKTHASGIQGLGRTTAARPVRASRRPADRHPAQALGPCPAQSPRLASTRPCHPRSRSHLRGCPRRNDRRNRRRHRLRAGRPRQLRPPIPDDATAAPNPIIVVEVLSPSTAALDAGGKLADYFRLPSVQHYLLVRPLRPEIIHHRRTGDRIETTVIRQGTISLNPPGIEFSLNAIYGP